MGNRPETDRLLHGHSVCLWCSREAAAGRLPLPSRSRGRAVPAGRGWCAGAVVSTALPPPHSPSDEIKRADPRHHAALLSRQSAEHPLPPGPGPGPLLRQPHRHLPQCPAGRPPRHFRDGTFSPAASPLSMVARCGRLRALSLPALPRPAPPALRMRGRRPCPSNRSVRGSNGHGGCGSGRGVGGHGRERPGPR